MSNESGGVSGGSRKRKKPSKSYGFEGVRKPSKAKPKSYGMEGVKKPSKAKPKSYGMEGVTPHPTKKPSKAYGMEGKRRPHKHSKKPAKSYGMEGVPKDPDPYGVNDEFGIGKSKHPTPQKRRPPRKRPAGANSGTGSSGQGHGHSSSSSSKGSSSHGSNRPGSKNHGGQGGGRPVGKPKSGGGSSSSSSKKSTWDEARTFVDDENNRLINDLLRQTRQARQDASYGVNTANSLFDRTKGDLDYLFNESRDYIGNRNQAIASGYQNTGTALGNEFTGLQNNLRQTSDTNRNAAMAELQRLGIQGAGLGQFDADAANAQNMAQMTGGFAQANNNTAANAAAEIGNLLGSMSSASQASAIGRATNSRNDEISNINQDYRKMASDTRNRIKDVWDERGGNVRELQRSLENDAYQRQAEGRQQSFNQMLAANQFNLDLSKFNADQLWQKAAQRQEAAAARSKRRHFQNQQKRRRTRRKANDMAQDAVSAVLPWNF